ncbi:MAG: LysM peptidoglycan-binding domain-containing protein, partial [Ilumatobacteraceae bacterium]|nr:LysM peptidoglycan-binding domain-containing protein [Ilumatobacteraceae bacterium]
TVADGDFEQRVADKFDVTLDALRAANNGTSNYSAFFPGLEIKIPAKADC